MADSPLLQRLDGIDSRFEEIKTLITDPAVIADQQRYVKLTKEYKHLEELLKCANQYKKLINDIEEAKLMLETETDADLKAMAREEIDANQAQLPRLEEDIKLELVPEDPEDSSSKSGAAQEATRLASLPATWPACTCATVSARAGKWRCRVAAKGRQVATRKSCSASPETTCTER